MRALAALLLLAAPALPCTTGAYNYCADIEFHAGTPVANYVVLFHTSSPDADMTTLKTDLTGTSKVQADGDDIRFFTTGGSALTACEISYANGTGLGVWAIRVPTSTTTAIEIRYGKADDTDASDCSTSTGAFQDYYAAHGFGALTDFSGNSLTLTAKGSTPATATSLVGPDSYHLNTTINRGLEVSGGIAPANALDIITVDLLIKSDNASDAGGANSNPLFLANDHLFQWRANGSTGSEGRHQHNPTQSQHFAPNTTNPGAAGTWYLITCWVSDTSGNGACYRNGTQISSRSDATETGNPFYLVYGSNNTGGSQWTGVMNFATIRAATSTEAEHDWLWAALNDPDGTFTLTFPSSGGRRRAYRRTIAYALPAAPEEWQALSAPTCPENTVEVYAGCVILGGDIDLLEGQTDR